MKKMLLYFVLFGLNFFTVHAAIQTNMSIINNEQNKELKEYDRLCSLVSLGYKIEGHLRRSAWYLNQAINLLNEGPDVIENLVDKAAWDFVVARIKGADPEVIDRYFSRNLPPLSSIIDEESISFGEYLTRHHTKFSLVDIREAMIKCYLPTLDPVIQSVASESGIADTAAEEKDDSGVL